MKREFNATAAGATCAIRHAARAAAMNAAIRSRSLRPGADSTPEETSTPGGRSCGPPRRHCRCRARPRASRSCRGRSHRGSPSRRPAHCRRAGRRPWAAWHRAEAGRRRRDRRPPCARSRLSRMPIAFITGMPNRRLSAATRSGGSWPWSCSQSGRTCSDDRGDPGIVHVDGERDDLAPAACMLGQRRCRPSIGTKRGLGGKKTSPTMSAPASSAASIVSSSTVRRS